LDQGQANKVAGGYLQTANADFDSGTGNGSINGEPLDRERDYIVAINDFLLTGFETGLDFLIADNPDLTILEDVPEVDIRQSFMDELQRVYGPPPTESNEIYVDFLYDNQNAIQWSSILKTPKPDGVIDTHSPITLEIVTSRIA